MSLYIKKNGSLLKIADKNKQADWTNGNPESLEYIKNKPEHSLRLIETSYENASEDSKVLFSEEESIKDSGEGLLKNIYYVRKWNLDPSAVPNDIIVEDTFRNKEKIESVFIKGERVSELWKDGTCFYQYKSTSHSFINEVDYGHNGYLFTLDKALADNLTGHLYTGTFYDDLGAIGDAYQHDPVMANSFKFIRITNINEGLKDLILPHFDVFQKEPSPSSFNRKFITVEKGARYYIRTKIYNENDMSVALLNGNEDTQIASIDLNIGWNLIEAEWLADSSEFNFNLRFSLKEEDAKEIWLGFGHAIVSKLPEGIFLEDIKMASHPENFWLNQKDFEV